jgi:class 3 adenylate cyclase
MEDFLKEINQDIQAIFQYNIETTNAYVVPTRHDSALTFPIGADKKGKLIETCVLMIDIRNSTKISRQLRKDKIKLGKIYSAFIYAMTNIADEYGYVRNIVGDRIMVVFEPKTCFIDAINCAATMHTVANRILAKHTGLEEFKIGIGIDYGEMLVLKTGIQKRYHEQSEHKGLVWVGDTANSASKLCDFANKNYSSPVFKVTYEYVTMDRKFKGFKPHQSNPLLHRINPAVYKPEPLYEDIYTTTSYTAELNYIDFSNKITVDENGWKYDGRKVTNFNIEKRVGATSPILISGKIFSEYKIAEPKSIYLPKLSLKDYPDRPNTGTGVYGGHLIVPEIIKIKI